ncbi:MAG: uroporphyrinogen-III synthase [Acidobacteria bacterium]|nr:uroporphyrinogen-III synthase [Acidobacteriota bacterium]
MTSAARERVVIVTQDDGAGSRLSALLAANGVRVWSVPVIVFEVVPDQLPIEQALARLGEVDWVVFTSARAAGIVCARPEWRGWQWSTAAAPRVAAVGPVTRGAVASSGAPVALCPANGGADELARAIIEIDGGTLAGKTVLWPRSAIARSTLRDLLVAAHARIIDPIAYTTRAVLPAGMVDVVRELEAGRVDAVTFLSPSSAEAFAAALGTTTLSSLAGRTVVASVGPTTTAALVGLGAPPAVEAANRTSDGLAAVLLGRFDPDRGAS